MLHCVIILINEVITLEMLQIKYFMKVASNESIKQTAARFRVPASSVSVAIKKLEKELGINLFDRTPNSLKLNANGKTLFQALENASIEFTKATTNILGKPETISGNIKLLVLTNEKIVFDIISKFKTEYPYVKISIQHSDYLEYGVYNVFDIVVTDRDLKSDIFERKPFISEEIFIAVNSASPLSALNNITYDNICDEEFALPHNGDSIREVAEKIFKTRGGHPHISITTEDYFEICETVKQGHGITFFPYISWRKYIDERIRLIKYDKGIYRNSYIYYRKNSSTAVKLFMNTVDLIMKNHNI